MLQRSYLQPWVWASRVKKEKKRQRDHPGTLQKSTFKGVAEEITGQRNLRKFKKQREKKV